MKLFLASEAKHPESMKLLEEYSGGLKGKKIGYIPTASNGESDGGVPWEKWKEGGSWKLLNTLGAEIDVILLEDYLNLNFPERLKDKDIIWMGGGMVGYLMYWIRRTNLDKYLPEVLSDNKKLYVGSSAGSMITSKNLDIAEWDLLDQEIGASSFSGLGWVDFDIWPHYEDNLYEEIKKRYTGEKLYLLKNGEAIIWEDGKIEVKGEERIIK